jgi:hypothetical protein
METTVQNKLNKYLIMAEWTAAHRNTIMNQSVKKAWASKAVMKPLNEK